VFPQKWNTSRAPDPIHTEPREPIKHGGDVCLGFTERRFGCRLVVVFWL